MSHILPDLTSDAGDVHLISDCGHPPDGWGPWVLALMAALTLWMAAQVALAGHGDDLTRTGRNANPVRVWRSAERLRPAPPRAPAWKAAA